MLRLIPNGFGHGRNGFARNPGIQKFRETRFTVIRGGLMKIISTLIAIAALPLMALGQTADQQKDTAQGQTNESQEKTPAKKKKAHAAHQPDKAQPNSNADANMHAETKATGTKKTQATAPSGKTQTKVNVQEFKSQHREVFTLGRHPKEFFVQRYGANHFRLIGNAYFVFVDSCWVAVDVAGFVFAERVICEGDPDFVVVY